MEECISSSQSWLQYRNFLFIFHRNFLKREWLSNYIISILGNSISLVSDFPKREEVAQVRLTSLVLQDKLN